MKTQTQTKAALSLLLCAVLAVPTVALAGKGGPKEDPTRDPSAKECTNVELATRCSTELDKAYAMIEALATNDGVFLSRNATQDAETLMCKVSGAEIKLAQVKDDEASYLLYTAMEKIWSLEGQGKMVDAGIMDLLVAAKNCVDNP